MGNEKTEKPNFIVPGGTQSISASAKRAGELLANSEQYYFKDKQLVDIYNEEFHYISAAQFCSEIEGFANIMKYSKSGLKNEVLSEPKAKQILASKEFKSQLPKIEIISRCPILKVVNDKLIPVSSFHPSEGIKVISGKYIELTYEEGKKILLEVLKDYNFASDSDRSRAFGAILTPCLILSGLISARSPLFLVEADKSQAGKGFFVKVINACYNEIPSVVTQKKGGVGSLEETFNSHLVKGRSFIAFDNIRGKFDSPAIESFMTEDIYSARIPYLGNVNIDARKVILFLTSNKAEMTQDLVNRSCVIRLLKQLEGYPFTKYKEGDLLDHIRANQGLYLGAIFTIVTEWFRLGVFMTNEARHDFRKWCRPVDWIVQNLLDQKPLMDSHKDTQKRMTNPYLGWLRDIAIGVSNSFQKNQWLRTSDLLDWLDERNIEIPSMGKDESILDGEVRKKVLLDMGRRLGKCFIQDGEPVNETIIDKIKISRRIIKEDRGNNSGPIEAKEYCFSPLTGLQEASDIIPLATNATNATNVSEENSFERDNDIVMNNNNYEDYGGDRGEEYLEGEIVETTVDLEFTDKVIPQGSRGQIRDPNNSDFIHHLTQLEKEGKSSCVVFLEGREMILQKNEFKIIKI